MPSDPLLTRRPEPPLKLVVTLREGALALSVSVSYLRELIRRGEVRVLRLPTRGGRARAIRIPIEELRRWIVEQLGQEEAGQ
jgi:Helix-turn-helix domain